MTIFGPGWVAAPLALLCVLASGGDAAASPLDRAATELVTRLELSSVQGFKLSDDLAVAGIAHIRPIGPIGPVGSIEPIGPIVPVGPIGGEVGGFVQRARLEDPLLGLVRARLVELGATSIFSVDAADPRADLEAAARDAGAEWLLLVRAEPIGSTTLRLWAELKSVDRGLWVPPPKPGESTIYATAEVQVPIDESLRSLLAIAEPDPRIGVDGAEAALRLDRVPVRIGSVEDRVIALGSCDVGPPFGRTLLVLSPRALSAYQTVKGALRRIGALDLLRLPRALEKVREPLGAIACNDASPYREIAFGTSDLKAGHVVRAELGTSRPGQSPELVFRETRAVDGIPLGYVSGGKLLLGAADHGRSRFSKSARIEAMGRTSDQDLKSPLLDVAFEPSAAPNHRMVGVSTDYRVLHFNDGIDGYSVAGSSGVGIRIVPDGMTVALVTTSSTARRDRDEVRLLSTAAAGGWRRQEAVPIEGSIFATTVAQLSGADPRAVIVAAYRATLRRTELYSVKLLTSAKPR